MFRRRGRSRRPGGRSEVFGGQGLLQVDVPVGELAGEPGLFDELLEPRDGGEHVSGAEHPELKHVAQVEDKVPVETLVQQLLALLLDEHLQGKAHLTVAHESEGKK